MNDLIQQRVDDYARALRQYVEQPDEEALKEAYEIGRKAIADHLGALDIAWLHREALSVLLSSPDIPPQVAEKAKLSSAFLSECLAPFEMTHRGFQDAVNRLSQRTTDLSDANRKLEAEIRDRKEVERVLRKRESQLAEAQKVAHLGSWEWDIQTNTITWTDELYNLFGLEPKGQPLDYERYLALVHPDDRGIVDSAVKGSAESHKPFEFDHRVLTSDGSTRWLHGIGRTVLSEDGVALRMVGSAQDITDRMRVEEARRRSEELFRSLIENASDLVAILNPTGIIRYQSPSIERILGYTNDEMVGRNAFELVHPDDVADVLQAFRTGITVAGTVMSKVFRFRHKTLGWRIIEAVGKNLLDVPGIAGIVVTSRDITEKVRLQEQLDEAAHQREEDAKQFALGVQRAQEEERQRIARELHDDICQRLSALRLQVNLVEDEFTLTDTAARNRLGSIKHSLDEMITDVRRISTNLRPTALDLFGLMTALRMLCEEMQKGVRVTVRFESNGTPESRFDAQTEIALYRIAQEALNNAAKHSHATDIVVTLSSRRGEVDMKIRDNGRGFDPSVVASPHGSRTGIGLTSMRERAELLGGKLRIDSTPQAGTTITIHLPTTTHEE